MKCYYCRKAVATSEHNEVQKLMSFFLDGLHFIEDAKTHRILTNTFVHMTPTDDEMDFDGDVVVCAEDFVREIAEQI